jgi:hypothetical protein
MNAPTAQQIAHQRMMESLPVRTHFKKEVLSQRGMPYAAPTPALLAKARELDGKMTRRAIGKKLGISMPTLTKKLGKKHR